MWKSVCLWVGVLAFAAAAAAQAAPSDDLQVSPADKQAYKQAWEGLKARLALGTVAPLRSEFGSADSDALKINSLSLMGDYYLSRPWMGTEGGLRATSGLLLGPRGSLWSSPAAMDRRVALTGGGFDGNADNSTLPYLGVGYTGLSSKSGWGLSADLGLMVAPRSPVHLGKFFSSAQSFDDTMRDLRFSPVLQLGVSYSF